jgi:hypothetical protein
MTRIFVDTNVLFPFSVMDLKLALTEDGRAGDPRGARASGEAVPCGGSGPRMIRLPLSAAPLVSLARFTAPHSPRLYPAGVSFKPKPRRMLSRFAFPRSAVKEFKRPSKVVEDAGHFKS